MHALFRWFSVLCLTAAGAALAQAPDTVFLNGNIISADEKGTAHQVLAIRDGRIAATGTTAAIKRLAGKQTRVRIGAGTGAHRVASYNPFIALRWMLDGKSAGGVALRGADETPTRLEALRMYTSGSAWFAHDEVKRGTLEVGQLADLAVLNRDYLTVPVNEIAALHSLLTMAGGRVVYADGPYKQFE